MMKNMFVMVVLIAILFIVIIDVLIMIFGVAIPGWTIDNMFQIIFIVDSLILAICLFFVAVLSIFRIQS